jgi:hypothetical protein
VACAEEGTGDRFKTEACNEDPCAERLIAQVLFELKGVEGSMNEIHEHRTIHTIAQELGVPTSSVVVRFSHSSGRRLSDALTTALIRTEEGAIEPEIMAEKYRKDLMSFITSGKFYEKLVSFGIFRGLTSVTLAECCEDARFSCCEIKLDMEWEGEVIPPLKEPEKVTDVNQAFEDQQEIKEYLPESWVVSVNVAVGIEGIDHKRKSVTYPNGEPIFRDTDFGTVPAQLFLTTLCDFESGLLAKEVGQETLDELKVREVKCFIPEFNDWLTSEGLGRYPVGVKFPEFLRSWLLTPQGRKWKGYAGFVEEDLKWVRIRIVTDLSRKSAAQEILKTMNAYDAVIEHRNEDLPAPDLEAWSCSISFVMAETEDGIVSSTFWCAIISLTCAVVSISLFTGSAILALTVSLTVAMVVACQAGTMFVVLGWSFGAVEAISIILFVGFSVDYTLHVAEAFHMSPPP